MLEQVTHEELEQDLLLNFNTNSPVYIQGPIGCGKSFTVKKVCELYAERNGLQFKEFSTMPNEIRNQVANGQGDISNKFIFFDIRAAGLDPSDIKGLPKLTGNFVEWIPDIVFKIASRKDFHGMLFFDEVNQAVPTVQSSLYQVILDNTAGTIKLSDNCLRCGAGNRSKDKSNVNKMSLALSARFSNVELAIPSTTNWIEKFARPYNVHRTIISYLSYQPQHLNVNPEDIKEQLNFANPRNWERLSKKLHELDKLHPKKDDKYMKQLERLAIANIGGEASMKFSAYCSLHDQVNHKEILDNPKMIEELSVDKQFFVLDMCVGEYEQKGGTKENKLVDKIAGVMSHVKADLAVNAYKNCQQVNKLFPNQFKESPKGVDWCMENMKYLMN